jgi:GTPase
VEDSRNAIGACVVIRPDPRETAEIPRSAESRLEEACNLAKSIGLKIVDKKIYSLRKKYPATLISGTRVEEIRQILEITKAGLVIVDHGLTPIQQRNLEKALNAKVIDRTALILEIFGERAATREGVLQVELASLEYEKSRLVRTWTHLERQRGGLGKTGGPGERQIESDRRIIRDKISRLKRELEEVKKTRTLHRSARARVPYPIVALAGYTNAGKSTLFNKLTGAGVLSEDALFATLDPTMRMLVLPSGRKVILSDTVGFISELPTELVAAFRATLEEVIEANLILHVRDMASPDTRAQREDVEAVLRDLGVMNEPITPIMEVLNKADLLPCHTGVSQYPSNEEEILVSAITGQGIENLLKLIDGVFARSEEIIEVKLDIADGKKRAWLYEHSEIIEEKQTRGKTLIKCRISEQNKARFEKL